MNVAGFIDPLNKFCERIINLAWLNVLWILFTLLGLGIFGWAPATVAMLSVFRKESTADHKFSIFHVFFSSYKKNFIQANAIGVILILGIFSFFYSISTLIFLDYGIRIILGTIFFIIFVFFGIVALFVFPVFVHYQISLIKCFRYAFFIGLSHLHYNLVIMILLVLLYILFNIFPGLLLFFALSIPTKCIMYFSLRIFEKIEKKQQVVF